MELVVVVLAVVVAVVAVVAAAVVVVAAVVVMVVVVMVVVVLVVVVTVVVVVFTKPVPVTARSEEALMAWLLRSCMNVVTSVIWWLPCFPLDPRFTGSNQVEAMNF
jgi:hypothetical protein